MADGEQRMPGHGGPRLRWVRLTAALTAVFALAGLTALAVPLARAAVHPPETAVSQTAASSRPQYVICVQDSCDRILDSLRRELSQSEQTAAEAALHRVTEVLPQGELQSSCGPPSQPKWDLDRRESTRTGRCSSVYSPPTIDKVRQA
ncbi:MAG TPA: hypothetical protein VHN18_20695, partial [Micromonosporaceae bacterium]|nr:hypothetical protein [Micromonosporaceae bacterium]